MCIQNAELHQLYPKVAEPVFFYELSTGFKRYKSEMMETKKKKVNSIHSQGYRRLLGGLCFLKWVVLGIVTLKTFLF